MNSLYNLAGRQSASIQADLASYASDPLSQSALRPQITAALSAMVKTVEDYEAMAKRELVIAKREKALGRAAHFYQEIKKFREQLSSIDTENQLDAFIAQGRSVLGNLVEQRGILKNTRRRLLDAANSVGMSREVIGYIDRMSTQDTIIFFVGAAFTLFAFYLIYHWLG
ncbi:protein transport protein bos1 [Malassezia equina]|uniref:Protein transport protein BOS1 n=1 Tax=Malassezia equina TaxID=1381935 RepID=A0AAF0IZ39_9BASI|nr:protein transport protein bos1 [Malassezia equina]